MPKKKTFAQKRLEQLYKERDRERAQRPQLGTSKERKQLITLCRQWFARMNTDNGQDYIVDK